MMTGSEESENMLYRISRGDERAFDIFMSQWSSRLYNYAMTMLQSRESVEEVVSDVFLEVWKSRGNLLKIEYLGQWLRTITYYKVVTRLRSETRRPKFVSLGDIEEFTIYPMESNDESILSHRQQEAVNEELESLSPKCKHVFFLAKIERMPYRQIATMLNISLSTVNYHVAYAMERLRNKLKNITENEH